jgi:hypothetical protein
MREKLPTVLKSVFVLFCCITFNAIIQSEPQSCPVLYSENFDTTNVVVVFKVEPISTSLHTVTIYDRLNRSWRVQYQET